MSGESHRFRNTVVVVAAGAVAVTGLQMYRNNECAVELAQGNIGDALSCALDASGGSSGEITAIDMKHEDLVDESLTITFGMVSMQMGGEGKFKYDGEFWRNFPGITDNEIYYNKGNRGTTEVRAMPCIRLGSDYKTALDVNDQPSHDGKSKVIVDVDVSADGSRIDKIDIDAGVLDLCAPHIALTPQNEGLWDERMVTLGRFGPKERAAYSYAMKDLILHGAMSQSCPENLLDMDKVEEAVETVVKGALSKNPAQAAMVAEAYAADRVETSIAPPEDRQQHYRGIYDQKRQGYHNGSAFEKGLDMKLPVISEISVRSCDAAGAIPKPAQ